MSSQASIDLIVPHRGAHRPMLSGARNSQQPEERRGWRWWRTHSVTIVTAGLARIPQAAIKKMEQLVNAPSATPFLNLSKLIENGGEPIRFVLPLQLMKKTASSAIGAGPLCSRRLRNETHLSYACAIAAPHFHFGAGTPSKVSSAAPERLRSASATHNTFQAARRGLSRAPHEVQ